MQPLRLERFGLPPGRKHHIYTSAGSEASHQPHFHDYYQLCYVDRGQILHCQEENNVALEAGDAFIVPPGFVHSVLFPDAGARVYSLSFAEDLFHPGFSHSNVYRFMTALKLETLEENRLDVRMKVHLSGPRREMLRSLLDSLIIEGSIDCAPELSAAGSLIAAAMCVLSQSYFDQTRLDNLEQYRRTMEACVSYIDAHFTEELTLSGLAHRFGLSRSRFSLLFPRFTGMTLKRYIAKRRIDHALALLHTTDLPVGKIAQMAGYEDLSTFYRNFTKITSTHPSEYRKEE